MFGTDMGCSGVLGEVEQGFLAVVQGAVHWRIDGKELQLDKPGGRGLRYRMRPTIYPNPELRPLRQGQRDGGDYRFGWQAGDGQLSLEWQWRDGPGMPWGGAGMAREPTWPVPRPDLLVGAAGTGRFVFGVVPVASARVLCQRPGGRAAVPLELFTIPGARTWRAVGGFVDRTQGCGRHRPGRAGTRAGPVTAIAVLTRRWSEAATVVSGFKSWELLHACPPSTASPEPSAHATVHRGCR
jgi:hypothetical protein